MSPTPIPQGPAAAMKALYENGYTIRKIHDLMGFSYGGIRNTLIRSHVKMRPVGRRPRKLDP